MPITTFNKLKNQKIKKMKKAQLRNLDKFEIKNIEGTPFEYATTGEKSYIVCGKVLMELDDNDRDKAEELIKQKAWSTIAILIQSMFYELVNNK